MGQENDEQSKLQNEDHTQEYIFLIELQQQYIYDISIEAGADTIAVSEQTIEESTDTTIYDCEECDTTIAEIDEEWLENGIYIRGYRYKDKLLQLVFYHDIGSKAL